MMEVHDIPHEIARKRGRVYHAFRLDPLVLNKLLDRCKGSLPRIPVALFVEQAIMEKLGREGRRDGV